MGKTDVSTLLFYVYYSNYMSQSMFSSIEISGRPWE